MSLESSIILKRNLLVVEGTDECFFFRALLAKLNLNNIQIICYEGKTRFRHFISALVATPGWANVQTLGISRDADEDPTAAFQSVVSSLRATGLSSPRRPLEITRSHPKTVVLILPDEASQGMLEDLCLRTVQRDSAMTCVNRFFQCLGDKRVPSPRNIAKAKVHVFLASRKDADKRLGEGALAGYWNFSSRSITHVKGFLRLVAMR